MQVEDYLPIGSVVLVKGTPKTLMIISRAIKAAQGGHEKFFDYGACLYPEGIMGDQAMYFNNENIEEIVWRGFENDEEMRTQKILKEAVKMLDLEKADIKPLEI